MKLGVRGKLFAVSLVVMLVVGLASGLFLEDALEGWLESRIEHELSRSAQVGRDLVEIAGASENVATFDPIADRLGESSEARVTIIDATGAVIGDSSLAAADVATLENHASRPEVRAALAHGRGISQRYSTTVKLEMIYVAVPYRGEHGTGVVRVSVPLAEVSQAVWNLRLVLLLAGLVGIALAVFMSGLASQLATRAIRRLVDSARAVVKGEGDRRLPVASSDELGRLAGSFNRVVEELDTTVTVMRDERDHLGTILESMSEGVISLDAEQRVTRANRAALELLDLDETPADLPLVETVRVPALVELVSGEPGDDASVEFDLGARRVQAHAAPLRTGGLVLVLRDVTRTRRLEKMRRDFVANVSHELRTPVSVIRANVETLVSGAIDDPDHAHNFLAAVSRNADRLSQLITDLLDLSRIEAGEYNLDIDPEAVAPVVERIVENLESRVEETDFELRCDIDPDVEVLADRRALEQIVFNLVDNALKYSNDGVVTVRARQRGDRVTIEVIDEGPGIESRHRDRIFERFYRADPGRSRDMGGTGLGLSIVKHLMEAMGGEVGFKPNPSGGSIFWLDFPAATEKPVDVVSDAPSRATPAAPHAVSAASAPVEIRKLPVGGGYEVQLRELRSRLLLMAGRVEEMIRQSVQALVERDFDLARATIASDHKVNRAELENDELCLVVLANRQPGATDLRFITLALKMVTDLERIGDIAVNICERAIDLAGAPPLRPWTDIEQMAEIAQSMVRDAIDAFVAGDVEKAQTVIARDNDVDELYTKAFRDVLAIMNDNPATIERGIHVQSVAKWLERIADHSTNLAEQVVFMVKGKDIRHLGKLPGPRSEGAG